MTLSVYDLYIAGVGCDMTGAVLLAWALLTRPRVAGLQWTMQRRGSFDATARHARDFVNGWAGVATIVAGLALQATGYMLNLAGHVSRAHSRSGVLSGAVILGVAVVAPLIVWWCVRGWGHRRYARAVASIDNQGNRREHPSALELVEFGTRLGYPARQHEQSDRRAYAKRVFGLDEVEEAD